MAPVERIEVPVHYDFASSLCHVTHRVMERIAGRFDGSADTPRVEFVWTPLDLAALLGWRRGAVVDEMRIANVKRVIRELSVPTKVPRTWLDSRRAMAVALSIGDPPRRAAAWRERVFTAIFEEGRSCDDPAEVARWAVDLDLRFTEADVDEGLAELERRTRAAAAATVTGVPTFMLAEWPMGGIQDDETMVGLINRFARRRREREASPP